jgi:sn-glycerol 3-phosphate transport system ATP-binding protein
VSFSADAGSLVVLLGPSGCGKSTTLRLIAGLEMPDAGRIEIAGRDVTRESPASRGTAMVFQSYALFPHLSVAENIVFGLKVRKVPRAERDTRLRNCSSASPPNSPAASSSGWRSAVPSSRRRRSASWTSRSPTLTRNCATRCAVRSVRCSVASA